MHLESLRREGGRYHAPIYTEIVKNLNHTGISNFTLGFTGPFSTPGGVFVAPYQAPSAATSGFKEVVLASYNPK